MCRAARRARGRPLAQDERERARQAHPRLAELLWERREEFALRRVAQERQDVPRGDPRRRGAGAATLSYWSDWRRKILGEVLPVDGPFLTYCLKEPVGVVGAIVPWNYPTCSCAGSWGRRSRPAAPWC